LKDVAHAETLKKELLETIRKFPKEAEKKFKHLGIYNRKDPVEEMDKWAET
jgi:hypothetical protein